MSDESEGYYLHSRCHIGSPTWVRILRDDDGNSVARVECAECRKTVTTLKLATPEGEEG